MSRRKQTRPQQLMNPLLGASSILEHDDQFTVKSVYFPPTTDSSSPSSFPPQSYQTPLAPDLTSGGLQKPFLPIDCLSHSCSPSQSNPCLESHTELQTTLSPSFSNLPLFSPTQPPTAPRLPDITSSPSPSQTLTSRTLMASPKLGVSATTTTSSSSSSSSASLCPPPHPGSPSPVPEGPPSPVTPSPSPGVNSSASAPPPRAHLSIALILEELRVLQQRQIHQMQMTEEICRQVLRLGGASGGLDTPQLLLPPLPQLCLEGGSDTDPSPPQTTTMPSQPPTSVAPLLACFSSLLPPQSMSKPSKPSHPLSHILRPHKPHMEGASGANAYPGTSVRPSAISSSSSASSAISSMASSNYPLALSLALPTRYLHEKSPNTSSASGHSGLSFLTPPMPTTATLASPFQEALQSGSGGGASTGLSSSSSSGRLQHACRFCGKMFSSDSSLQIHLRSHTGERPYQCPVCLSRFTTRGNLKVHFLRHREQNPELSLSLLPPSLFGSAIGAVGAMGGSEQGQSFGTTSSSSSNLSAAQRRRKRRAEDEPYGDGLEIGGGVGGFPMGASTGGAPPSSLPLPPSMDLALISTAHSILQLNRAAAAAAAAASISSSSSHTPTSSSSSSSSSSLASSLLAASSSSPASSAMAGFFKGAKQQRFDENTPPHTPMLPPSTYSQLAHLPKLLFPSASSSSSSHQHPQHHPSLGLLRPPPPSSHHLSSTAHSQLSFPFSHYPKTQGGLSTSTTSPSSSTSIPSSDTSKLQRLVEKLEKDPGNSHPWASSSSTTSSIEALAGSLATSSSSIGLFSSGLMGASTSSTYVMASPPSSTHPSTSISNFTREMVAALGMSANGASALAGAMLPSLGIMGAAGALAPNQCGVCLRVLSCPRALRLHQATHLGERPFPCKLCGRSFSTKASLRSHLATHRARPPNARAQNSCPLCQRKFTNALVLQHHIRMHLGGQLPPEGTEDALSEQLGEPEAPCLQPPDTPSSGTFPPASGSQSKSPARSQFPASIGVTVPISASVISLESTGNPSRSHSSSPDLIPPSDLSPDPSLNPDSHTPPTGRVDPPVLCVSAPSPCPPLGDQGSPVPEEKQAESQDGLDAYSTPGNKAIPTSPPLPKPICMPSLGISESSMDDNSPSMDVFLPGPRSNLEDLLSTPTHGAPVAHPCSTLIPTSTAPATSPEPFKAQLTPGPDTDQPSRSQTSQLEKKEEEEEEERAEVRPSATPKYDHAPVLEVEPRMASMSETMDTSGGESTSVPQSAATFIRETRQGLHFSFHGKEDRMDSRPASERLETTVPMSMAPTLPPPMSRPEKKTYSCAECGKEYASRSGLKGHMKHHSGVVKTTRPPARSNRAAAERLPATTPSTSCHAPATRSSVGFWNQYQAFLNTSNEPTDQPAQGPTSVSQGEEVEMPRLDESPVRSQIDVANERGSVENKEVSVEEQTLKSM